MPVTLVDSYYYGRLVIAPLNIVLYNIFSDHGPDLYGTSPWTFYFLNGFLNFNVVFLLGLLVFPAVLVTTKFKPMKRHTISVYIALLPFYLWILIFFSQAHKVYSLDSIFMLYFRFNNDLHQQLWLQEERFLYPIYPLIGLSAAITWTCVESCLRALKLPEKFTQYLTFALVVSSSVISISRVVGQYRGIYKIWSIFFVSHVWWILLYGCREQDIMLQWMSFWSWIVYRGKVKGIKTTTTSVSAKNGIDFHPAFSSQTSNLIPNNLI